MDRGSRVPEDLAFVVQPDARQGRFMLPVGVATLVVAVLLGGFSAFRLASGFGDYTDMTAIMVAFALIVAGTMLLLAQRTVLRNGPVLGANRHGLWVALGGLMKPVALHLSWSEVSGLGIRYANERRKRSPHLGVTLTEDGRAQLDREPGQRAAARKNTALMKAPIVVDAATMGTPLDEVLRGLRVQAPRRVEVEESAAE